MSNLVLTGVGAEFTFPAQPASKGSYLYVSTESTGFASYFGFAPDFVSSSAASINGDDAIELFQNGVLVDVFGDVNVDGTGRPIPFRRRALPSRRHWSSTRCWVRPLAPIPSSSNWWAGQASRWRDTA